MAATFSVSVSVDPSLSLPAFCPITPSFVSTILVLSTARACICRPSPSAPSSIVILLISPSSIAIAPSISSIYPPPSFVRLSVSSAQSAPRVFSSPQVLSAFGRIRPALVFSASPLMIQFDVSQLGSASCLNSSPLYPWTPLASCSLYCRLLVSVLHFFIF